MNNQVQFICLWCCVPPDFVVQINNFFRLTLFSAAIDKRRRKKLIIKIIKYKVNSSSEIQFAFFYPKYIQKFFLKNYRLVENLKMTQIAARRGGSHVLCVIMTQCVLKLIYDLPLIFREEWLEQKSNTNGQLLKSAYNMRLFTNTVFSAFPVNYCSLPRAFRCITALKLKVDLPWLNFSWLSILAQSSFTYLMVSM